MMWFDDKNGEIEMENVVEKQRKEEGGGERRWGAGGSQGEIKRLRKKSHGNHILNLQLKS